MDLMGLICTADCLNKSKILVFFPNILLLKLMQNKARLPNKRPNAIFQVPRKLKLKKIWPN